MSVEYTPEAKRREPTDGTARRRVQPGDGRSHNSAMSAIRRTTSSKEQLRRQALDSIADPGADLIEELRAQEGDARGIQSDLEDEIYRLTRLTRGALYLARHAVDLAMDPPAAGRFVARTEVLAHLLGGPEPTDAR